MMPAAICVVGATASVVASLVLGGTPKPARSISPTRPPSSAPLSSGAASTVSKRVLGSVTPLVAPVVMLGRSWMFWSTVLTPLPLQAVPGSVPTTPSSSVTVPARVTRIASLPLKEKLACVKAMP
jgi:hypothetical protein